jgi:hypothetical protein
MNIQADGAGMTLFRGIKSLQPAPLLNGIVQWEQFRILKRLFAFQNNQRLLGFRTTSESRSARFGTIRLRAPAEIASARRSETPQQALKRNPPRNYRSSIDDAILAAGGGHVRML